MKVQAYNLSMSGVISRFYLMMATAIVLGVLGVNWTAAAFITFIFAFSIILGISFEWETSKLIAEKANSLTHIKGEREIKKVG